MVTKLLAAPPPGSNLKSVPGAPGFPLLGTTFQLKRDPWGFTTKRREKYGPVSWSNILFKPMVLAQGPEAARSILINRDKAFASGPGWTHFIGPFFRRGILMLDFDEHQHHRRILQQAFTKDRLKSYLQTMAPAIKKGVDTWRPGAGFTMYDHMKQLTLDLATEVFMGCKVERREIDRVNAAFVDAVRAGTAYIRFPVPGLRWQRGLKARKLLENFFYQHLPAKRAGGGDDLFAALCEAETADGDRFTDEDIVNHMIFALLGGHDTSCTTMATMCYYLAKYPEWQDRLREESFALGTSEPDHADLDKLVSIELVMKESLRLVAPVPALPRRAVKDTEVLGYYIPKGTFVLVPTLTNHYLEEFWPDPYKFDPERFAEHRREDKVHYFAWEPFGGGAHRCVGLYFAGMQIKAVLHHVLQRYRWSVPEGYTWPLDTSSLPVPKDGLPVLLEEI